MEDRNPRQPIEAADRTPAAPLRVFLGYSSELRDFPPGESFVAAAEAGAARAGAIINIPSFASRDGVFASHIEQQLRGAEVYIGLIGLRYGSPVRDAPEMSYIELECQAAASAGIPRLLFMLEDSVALRVPADRLLDDDPSLQVRQRAFRDRLLELPAMVAKFSRPDQLELMVFQGLTDLVNASLTRPTTTRENEQSQLTPLGSRGQYLEWERQIFGRLSPSSMSAMAYADGLRESLGEAAVHMEHLIFGLYQKEDGPTRQLLLNRGGIDQSDLVEFLANATGMSRPSQEIIPTRLRSLPPVSPHVTDALNQSVRFAGESQIRSRDMLRGALSVANCSLVKALASVGVRASDVETPDLPRPPVGRAPLLAGATPDTVPEPGDGRVRAADRLGISTDVEMLVSVLLAKDTQLPLAIGLFGNWGSGKSFFMARMQERIAELSKLADEGRPEAWPFCREVRQVRFNAWHYVDTNLWASLAATLFDELAQVRAPDATQAKLTELDEARIKADEARQDRQQLEDEVAEAEASAGRITTAIRVAAPLAIRAVRDDPKLVAKLRRAAQPGDETDTPTAQLVNALGEIDSAGEKTRAAWRLFQEEVLHRRRWATLIVLVLFVAAGILASVITSWPTGLKVLTFAGATAASLMPALSGALRLLYLVREAREARELPVVEKREALAQAQAREDDAERLVTKRERELADLRDKGLQLQEFVRERAASSDYRGKLGVISQIRRDFEQLAALLPAAQPSQAEETAAVVAAVTERVPEVERIVLFIDDLDRCPHQKVVEVLQAVHLLLAFRLFVVVVGVDSRWLEHSLREHYQSLLAEPADYLEKIFQIPFVLRHMTLGQYRDLIYGLTVPAQRPDGDADADAGRDVTPSRPGHEDAAGAAPEGVSGQGDPAAAGETQGSVSTPPAPREPPSLPRPEALLISGAERELLGQIGGIVPTPRAAKRLINIYRMLRVGVSEDELEQFLPGGGNEFQVVILLVGLLVGRPAHAHKVLQELEEAESTDDAWEILRGFEDVWEWLATVRDHIEVTGIDSYRRWAPRVARFSFRTPAFPVITTGRRDGNAQEVR